MTTTTLEISPKLKELVHFTGESPLLDSIESSGHRYTKDLKVNIGNVLRSDSFSEKEAALLALAVAANNKNDRLFQALRAHALEREAGELEIADVTACVSLMAANNVLYRFRHFMGKESYQNMPAGLKMNIMLKPKLGKEFFELLSLVLSAVNGCELCVKAHEDSLIKMGVEEKRVWDAIRLASVINSLDRVLL